MKKWMERTTVLVVCPQNLSQNILSICIQSVRVRYPNVKIVTDLSEVYTPYVLVISGYYQFCSKTNINKLFEQFKDKEGICFGNVIVEKMKKVIRKTPLFFITSTKKIKELPFSVIQDVNELSSSMRISKIPIDYCVDCLVDKIFENAVYVDNSDLILLLGIHRTLSGCVAECLEKLGVFMGSYTTKGEDRDFAQICENEMPFPSMHLNNSKNNRRLLFMDWLQKHRKDAKNSRYGVKYPHACVLAKEISDITSVKIINLERPINQSIQSLSDRSIDALPQWYATDEECKQLQSFLQKEKNSFLKNKEYLTVHSDNLLSYPARELGRLIKYLDLSPTKQQWDNALVHIQPSKAFHTPNIKKINNWEDCTTICVKAFERPDCVDRLIRSIKKYYPNVPIFIADDSKNPPMRNDAVVFPLSYDSGISFGRNHIVQKVKTPYLVMLDDDMEFIDQTRIEILWEELHYGNYDLVAGKPLTHISRPDFEGHFEIYDDTLHLLYGPVDSTVEYPVFHTIENNFIVRTEKMMEVPWDNELKIGEHLEWCIKAWQSNLKIGFIPYVRVIDGSDRPLDVYNKARNRAKYFRDRSLKKWGKKLGFKNFVIEKNPKGNLTNMFEEINNGQKRKN